MMRITTVAVVAAMTFGAAQAHAEGAVTRLRATGTVSRAEADYGVSVGDPATAILEYDESWVYPSYGVNEHTWAHSPGGMSAQLIIGPRTWAVVADNADDYPSASRAEPDFLGFLVWGTTDAGPWHRRSGGLSFEFSGASILAGPLSQYTDPPSLLDDVVWGGPSGVSFATVAVGEPDPVHTYRWYDLMVELDVSSIEVTIEGSPAPADNRSFGAIKALFGDEGL
jgi:hypothetical protein